MTNISQQIDELIALGTELVNRGLVLGSGGNLSFRAGDIAYVTRSGAPLHQLTSADFMPVPINESYHHPDEHPRPSIETPMHLAAYRTRADARFIAHCHPVHAIAWAMQADALPAITPDFAVYVNPSIPVVSYLHPGSEPLASAVSQTLQDNPALLLANHGVLVTGDSTAKTLLRTLLIDETAHICLLAAAAGNIRPLEPHEIARFG
jgi:L-fuculose-phosphate aldolase